MVDRAGIRGDSEKKKKYNKTDKQLEIVNRPAADGTRLTEEENLGFYKCRAERGERGY